MKVLVTGADGFIGKNLLLRLQSRADVEVVHFTREHDVRNLPKMLDGVECIFHLAGVNRPQNESEFFSGNVELTRALCNAIAEIGVRSQNIRLVYTSSTQAILSNPYGISKRAAENAVFLLNQQHSVAVSVFRLPNMFGKWCRPDYNSVIATFCSNVANGKPITVNDPKSSVTFLYIDDIIDQFIKVLDGGELSKDIDGFVSLHNQYTITVGELADLIVSFKHSRQSLMIPRVGAGFIRALYSTYISYLPTDAFSYEVPMYADERGIFSEILKTPECGQFSYFTARPGITRGGHYHHTKTEKFLVVLGKARFRFRNMQNGETFELITTGEKAEVVDTIPGWAHDITNIGKEDLVVLLWANEIFDRSAPDTYISSI